MDAFGEGWVNSVGPIVRPSWNQSPQWKMCVPSTTMVGHSFSCFKHTSIDPRIACAHVEASSMINIRSPAKYSMSLIVGWAFNDFPWRLKLNVAWIVRPSALTTTIPIWATTITKFDCCQLEAKANKAQMTWLLPILASPPSHAKNGFVGVGLSYELSNMRLTIMNMACCFLLIL